MGSGGTAIVLEGLEKSFGTQKALDGLSMTVETGSVTGFIGPNGAGKTTSMRILLGLLPKDKGRVVLLGEEVRFGGRSHAGRRLAYLPQEPVFPERHTAWEVMELVGSLYGMEPSEIRERSTDLLGAFRLDKHARKSAGVFSRGMKQRLGLAACFLPRPELLILDEPVSALDPEGRVEVFEILRELKGKATVLFSSHILEDVERVSDSLVMIKEGRKVLEGPVSEILQKYAPGRFRMRVNPDDLEKAKRSLKNIRIVSAFIVADKDSLLEIDVASDDMNDAADTLVSHLVHDGVRVREFARAQADLESVFMRLSPRQTKNEGDSR